MNARLEGVLVQSEEAWSEILCRFVFGDTHSDGNVWIGELFVSMISMNLFRRCKKHKKTTTA